MLRRIVSTTATRFYSNAARQFVVAKKPRSNRLTKLSIFGVSFGAGWFLTQHLTFADLMAWWLYENVPENDEGVKEYKKKLTARADQLPVVKQLKQCGYTEVFSSSVAPKNTLIDKTLSVPGAIAIPPKFYYNPQTKETVGIYHLGMRLAGYPFLVHGGILATVMEDLMRESVKLIKGVKTETTDGITVSYKFPTLANQFVVVRTTKAEQFGKNVKLTAEILDQSGNKTLVKGRGTFST